MSIEHTKARMNYQHANQRPACNNCKHAEQAAQTRAYNDQWPWRCTKGGFGVTAQAVCSEHERKPR